MMGIDFILWAVGAGAVVGALWGILDGCCKG